MEKKFLLVALVFFGLVGFASAATQINIYVDVNGDALFLGETDGSPELPEGVSVRDGQILGATSELTSKQGNVWTFDYGLEDSEFNVVFPEGAVIKELSNGEIYLDGRQIAVFVVGGVSVSYTIEETSNNVEGPSVLILFGVIVFAIVILGVVFLINFRKREKKEKKQDKKIKQKKPDKIEMIKQVLNEREKLILEKLKETGKIKTSYLRKMLDIPKASFSRNLQELEKKELVKRTGEGKNKFVELKK